MDRPDLTVGRLHEVLDYEPDRGLFHWKRQIGKRAKPGSEAGTVDVAGYLVITIDRKRHKAHRLAWLYVHGEWPPVAVDHRNGQRTDNKLANLRLATWAENQENRKIQRNNRSGFLGVSWDAGANAWRAGIRKNRRSLNLGNYSTPEAAHAAYLAAKASLHTFQPVPRHA